MDYIVKDFHERVIGKLVDDNHAWPAVELSMEDCLKL